MNEIIDTIKLNLDMLRELNAPFKQIFNLWLKDFWINNVFGFNILAFNDAIDCPEDISLSDYVLENYGKEGHDMIFRLLGKPPEDLEPKEKTWLVTWTEPAVNIFETQVMARTKDEAIQKAKDGDYDTCEIVKSEGDDMGSPDNYDAVEVGCST